MLSVAGPDASGGLTSSTVTPVSVEPPLILACVASRSRTLAARRAAGSFGLHLLRDDQEHLAQACAQPGTGLGGVPHRLVAGVSTVQDALAWAVCNVVGCRRYGDHHVLIARLLLAQASPGLPRIWHASGFTQLRPAKPHPEPEPRRPAGPRGLPMRRTAPAARPGSLGRPSSAGGFHDQTAPTDPIGEPTLLTRLTSR